MAVVVTRRGILRVIQIVSPKPWPKIITPPDWALKTYEEIEHDRREEEAQTMTDQPSSTDRATLEADYKAKCTALDYEYRAKIAPTDCEWDCYQQKLADQRAVYRAAMKPDKPMLTAGQKPMAKDSLVAFVLFVGGLFLFLPWWKALLAIAMIFGAAFPLVLCERQMIFAYNDGRPFRHWGWIGLAIAVAMLIGIGVYQFHRFGLW